MNALTLVVMGFLCVGPTGDARYAVRDRASRTLDRLGWYAVPAAWCGSMSGDAEVRARCQRVVGPVSLGRAVSAWLWLSTPAPRSWVENESEERDLWSTRLDRIQRTDPAMVEAIVVVATRCGIAPTGATEILESYVARAHSNLEDRLTSRANP
jgi:hypothetical protein